jgi:2-polyprenyl-6-methoxyphenol hydroxylase-like FAD-dependent oxidoreductase
VALVLERELLGQSPVGALENLWRVRSWPMFDRLLLEKWVDGNVALLGDLVSRHVVGTDDDGERLEAWARALREYNEIREPRTSRVQTTARVWGESWHLDEPVALWARERLRRRRPFGLRNLPRQEAGESNSTDSIAAGWVSLDRGLHGTRIDCLP